MKPEPRPVRIELVGDTLAIAWADGSESFLDPEFLRLNSPSAENQGEVDILGNRHGGDDRSAFPGVRTRAVRPVGNYAVQLVFSDGHRTGLFSWPYLRRLAAEAE